MTRSRNDWTRVRFGDVVRLSTERCTDPVAQGIDRYLGLEHLEPGDLRIRSWGNVADGVTFTNRFRPGQVLFGKRRAYQRKVAVAEFDGICSSDIYVFEPADNRLLPGLLPFICQTDGFFEHALKTSAGSLSPRTNWSSLADYEFDLPPLKEQRRLCSGREAIEEGMECYRGLLQQLRSTKRAAMACYVSVTEGCRSIHIRDVCNVVRGSTPRPAGDSRYFNGDHIPWITVGEITRDEWPYLVATESRLTIEGSQRSRRLDAGTVVLTNSGFSLGVPKILAITGCANDGVAAFLDLDASVIPEFLYYCLFSMTSYLRNVIAAGGDQPNLNTSLIGALVIPKPSLTTQRQVVKVLQGMDEAIRETQSRLLQLRRLSAGMLKLA
jgi:type I restriction enzyme S subunit